MKRTRAVPGPQDYAANYVTIATRAAAKVLAQPDTDTVPVTLVAVVGGGWHLIGCDAVLGEGSDQELSDAGKRLTRAVVSELGVEDRSRLLARMDSRDELPGIEPAHFKIALNLAGASWSLRVSACANGAASVVGEIAGTLVAPGKAA